MNFFFKKKIFNKSKKILKLFLSILFLKDSLLFLQLLKICFFNNYKKRYKLFFLYFIHILKIFKFFFFFKGLKFIVNGKFGLSGLTRTKKNFLILKKSSFTDYKLKIDYSKINLYSKCGIFGCKLFFFF